MSKEYILEGLYPQGDAKWFQMGYYTKFQDALDAMRDAPVEFNFRLTIINK